MSFFGTKDALPFWVTLVLFVATLGLSFGIILLLCLLLEKVILPSNYLFYEMPITSVTVIMLFVFVPTFLLNLRIVSLFTPKRKPYAEAFALLDLWRKIGKWKILVAVIYLFLFYSVAFNFTCVCEDGIKQYSPFKPVGETYSYSDVDLVITGFGQKSLTFSEYNRKGNFYYTIYVDGKKINFGCTSPNKKIERYQKDSYLELEEFDQKLVNLNVRKFSDIKGVENCNYDKRYVDRFVRIINNKPNANDK